MADQQGSNHVRIKLFSRSLRQIFQHLFRRQSRPPHASPDTLIVEHIRHNDDARHRRCLLIGHLVREPAPIRPFVVIAHTGQDVLAPFDGADDFLSRINMLLPGLLRPGRPPPA